MPQGWLNQVASQISARYIWIAVLCLITLIVLLRLPFSYYRASDTEPGLHSNLISTSAANKALAPILNSTLGFEKVLAINLPERTDHHDGLVLASSMSDVSLEFVSGVNGNEILDKVLPANHAAGLPAGVKGAWRAHINAISEVVENGWASALIIEDDIDWDIRLKSQLQEFALASQQLLRQGRNSGTTRLKDPTSASLSSISPYGDHWDVLWLGHCGMELPIDADATIVRRENDVTVPQTQHQKSWDEHASSPLEQYPQHTRVIAEQHQGTCSLAYAVSLQGARKILLALGLRRLDMAFDLMLREWCRTDNGGGKPMCIGVLPQLFDHHRRVGPNEIDSDISGSSGQYRDHAYTLNIRWSVRLNIEKLLRGDTNYDDQWPDS